MLSHCFLLLCIGGYVSCMPAQRSVVGQIQRGLIEIQNHLDYIINQQAKVTPQHSTMTSLPIPQKLQKACARYNLDTFINSLILVKIEASENVAKSYANMLAGLKQLAKHWHAETESHNCTTSSKSVDKLLEELEEFLRDLHVYL